VNAPPAAQTDRDRRDFDGVICFGGGDWWYHNRGHFDFQMMKRLAAHVPVLYVNSIGVRMPSIGEGGMFVKRVTRKLRSISKGFTRIDHRWGVCSPFVVPGKLGMTVTGRLLPTQVRHAARKLGISRPLVWVVTPTAADAAVALRGAAVVYQRTDRHEEYPGADRRELLRCHHLLAQHADATIYCSRSLMQQEAAGDERTLFIDHGVDFARFADAGRAADLPAARTDRAPADIAHLPRPRVGFIGGIDAHTFDPPLFLNVADQLSDVNFVMVGGCSLPDDWCALPNVTLLGRKPYDDVAAYMAAADVLIMPWNDSDWIKACNPVKLKEYLAAGRPVVSTPFDELDHYRGFIHVATDADSFAAAIRDALASPDDPERLRARVEAETWDAKATRVLNRLAEIGVAPNAASATADTRPPHATA
jgi:glycosyltransferase involved in cell wall biosynthesis